MPTLPDSASLQHPLGRDASIPKKIDEERLLHLTQRLKSRSITKEEREELGRSFIRLALKIASSYSGKRPNKADDYAGAALFGIAYALEKAPEKLVDENITAWVISCVRRFVRRFYEMDHMVRVPSTTYHAAKLQGREIERMSVLVVDGRELNHGNDNKASVLFQRMRVQPSHGTVFELKEMLQLSARDERDRTIIRLRIEGYNDSEIADQLEISTSYVQRKRREIEGRFNRLNSES